MQGFLSGRTVGFLVAQSGADERELSGPLEVLAAAGATTLVVAPAAGTVQTVVDGVPAAVHAVDRTLESWAAEGFDALVLPDGEAGSVALRAEPSVGPLLARLAESDRPIGAFGHAVWSLMDAGLLAGRQTTSHPSMRRELERAGARWHDRRVVVDGNLITSRSARDLEAFNTQLVAYLDR